MENKPQDKADDQHSFENSEVKTIPVITEDAIIDRKVVEKGGIVIEKKVTGEEILLDIPLTSEEIRLERVPVNKYLDSRPENRYEGDTLIIPVIKEVMVKRLLLVEEIHITKEVHRINKQENITLKKEEITINSKDLGSGNNL
jgi:uncharacterized protein (TIGR02271 family)